jgi:hypothetical protein
MFEDSAQQFNESAAYHEAGHITAAFVQAMSILNQGLRVDLYGHGCAKYYDRPEKDLGKTDGWRRKLFPTISLVR